MRNNKILLTGIIILAFALRLFRIDSIPPSLNWDEAAWGYNAYSLGNDFKDEFGVYLPITYLESFGDFKPPVYAYLAIIPVKIFGLSEFAVRFPSAFFGGLTVIVTYFLVLRLFPAYQYRIFLATISALILAISPWHINLSRAGYEANVASFFIVSGVWSFLAGIQNKKYYLLLSAIFFVLSIYTFNTARIVSPLLVVFLAIYFHKELIQKIRISIVSVIVGVILLLPAIPFLLSPQASLRFKEVNIFSDSKVIERSNQQIENDENAFWSKIIHNRRLSFGVEYLKHYFDNFNTRFLFIDGDENPRFGTRDTGILYLWEFPFLIGGILFAFKKREKHWLIFPVWLMLGILPAATARETPHALRIETVIPTFQIFTSYGLVHFLLFLKTFKKTFKLSLIGVLVAVLILNLIYYLYGYYSNYSREFSKDWQYGYEEAYRYANSKETNYNSIVFTNDLGRPYIYYLFYNKIDPTYFRENSTIKRDVFGFVKIEKVGKYIFTDSVGDANISGKVLRIGTIEEIPKNAKVLKKFNLLNGETLLIAFEL